MVPATGASPGSEWKPADAAPYATARLGEDGAGIEVDQAPLLYASAPYFIGQLRDEAGNRLLIEDFHEDWANEMTLSALLVLMAPRDHGKTTIGVGYMAWRAWRHNRDPVTGELLEGLPDGKFEAVIFSKTLEQAKNFYERWQSLVLANEHLFGDVLPHFRRGRGAEMRGVWSRTRTRLRNRFELSVRSWRTSTRGLHPNLLYLDDVLDENNSLTSYQRDKSWRYMIGVLLPMNPEQIVVIGTAQHYDDIYHRLAPGEGKPRVYLRNRPVRFRHLKYRALHWPPEGEDGVALPPEALWAFKHSVEELESIRDRDPVQFAREYQNDPRDASASLFPFELTGHALLRGAELTFLPLEPGSYRRLPQELVLLGMDIAASESVGADYTVIEVAAFDRGSGDSRLLWAGRWKGASFGQQLDYLGRACEAFGVDVAVVENNAFQRWLHAEALKDPRTAGRVIGHTTGREKQRLEDGVPSMKIGLGAKLWVVPSGDAESRAFAQVWQAELNAFGWKDDKLEGIGEHDDTVMAWWFLDIARRQALEWIRGGPPEQVLGPAEVAGVDEEELRERIGEDF